MCCLITIKSHQIIIDLFFVAVAGFMHSDFWECFYLYSSGLHTFIATADTSIDIFITASVF